MEDKPTQLPQQCDRCHKPIVQNRLSLKYLISDAVSTIFNLERGLIFTFWELLKNPGVVVNEFISGNRFKYFNPFRLIFLAATIAVITESLTGTISAFAGLEVKSDNQDVNAQAIQLLREYQNVLILTSAPLIALGSYISLRKRKWNYAEHLVVNSYGYAVTAILGSLFSVIIYPFPDGIRFTLEAFSQLFYFYVAYVYIRTWKLKVFKGIMVFLSSTLISSLIGMLIGVIVILAIILTKK